jgi:hypothetical protein
LKVGAGRKRRRGVDVKTLGYSVASSLQINPEAFLFCMEVPNVGGSAAFPKMKGERRGKLMKT